MQVAAGDDDHDCKWSIFASCWKEKHHQHKLRSVKTILGTSIGAGCSNQMQLAQGHHLYNYRYIYIPSPEPNIEEREVRAPDPAANNQQAEPPAEPLPQLQGALPPVAEDHPVPMPQEIPHPEFDARVNGDHSPMPQANVQQITQAGLRPTLQLPAHQQASAERQGRGWTCRRSANCSSV